MLRLVATSLCLVSVVCAQSDSIAERESDTAKVEDKTTAFLKAKAEFETARKQAIANDPKLQSIQQRIDTLSKRQAELLEKLNGLAAEDATVARAKAALKKAEAAFNADLTKRRRSYFVALKSQQVAQLRKRAKKTGEPLNELIRSDKVLNSLKAKEKALFTKERSTK